MWPLSLTTELTYSRTYQIIISPNPSIPDFVYTPHFAQKNYFVYTRSAKPVTVYACVGVRRKAREIFLFTLTFARNRDCRMVFKDQFSRL